MLARISGYVRAHHMGLLALFVALGGTSYAAIKLPANSVGTKQLKKNAVTLKKIKRSTRDALKGQKGDTGPRGEAGAIGPRGVQGPAGSIGPPEAWHEVAAGSTTQDLCGDPANTAVYCSIPITAPFLYDPWRNFGGSLATAGFYKDQLGIVHLKGVVAKPVAPLNSVQQDNFPKRFTLFRLPTGYRPEHARIFPTVGAAYESLSGPGTQQEEAGRVDVDTDGLVVLEADCVATGVGCSANGPYLTLDGISFRPDE